MVEEKEKNPQKLEKYTNFVITYNLKLIIKGTIKIDNNKKNTSSEENEQK